MLEIGSSGQLNVNNDYIKTFVASRGWLSGLDENKIESIVEQSYLRRYTPGELIYMVGDEQKSVFCIIDGRVKISIMGRLGEEFTLAIWEAGACFGESSFQSGGAMPLEASPLTESMVLVIPHSVIDRVLEDRTVFYRNVMNDMIDRSKRVYQLVEFLLFSPLHARLAARILHFIELYGEPGEEGIVLPIRFSQKDLASMAGGSRQRVNQIFRKWADRNIVSKQGKYYVVHDTAALEKMLEAKKYD